MEDLEQLIDWSTVMQQPRSAGGHWSVMEAIFGNNASVIATWDTNDYQGNIAIAYQLSDGCVVLMTDYYGSCSGCDAWEDASDEDARQMILDLVHGSKHFPSIEEAIDWCSSLDLQKNPEYYSFRDVVNLVQEMTDYMAKAEAKAEAEDKAVKAFQLDTEKSLFDE